MVGPQSNNPFSDRQTAVDSTSAGYDLVSKIWRTASDALASGVFLPVNADLGGICQTVATLHGMPDLQTGQSSAFKFHRTTAMGIRFFPGDVIVGAAMAGRIHFSVVFPAGICVGYLSKYPYPAAIHRLHLVGNNIVHR